jgi:hypothetical protein
MLSDVVNFVFVWSFRFFLMLSVLVVLLGVVFMVFYIKLVHWTQLQQQRDRPDRDAKFEHFELFGDSMLDNEPYTGVTGCVAQTLAARTEHKTVGLSAIDGDVIQGVVDQLDADPVVNPEHTLAVVSMGGNNALILLDHLQCTRDPRMWFKLLWKFADEFQREYEQALLHVAERYRNVCVLNIYHINTDHPGLRMLRVGTKLLDMAITRVCRHHGVPVIDVMNMFDSPSDYANPIEPSSRGSYKIVSAIQKILLGGADRYYRARGSAPKKKGFTPKYADRPMYKSREFRGQHAPSNPSWRPKTY